MAEVWYDSAAILPATTADWADRSRVLAPICVQALLPGQNMWLVTGGAWDLGTRISQGFPLPSRGTAKAGAADTGQHNQFAASPPWGLLSMESG
ncbi:hypothetical protein PAAG_05694 [Paracoccidioides lutzii Pb01]|uniref:Uncharacterized protein n=1 Tax=Paracoccidioides lutzii (strain ATCC MYA-826 / Pb01) TaxID=502779 RepID=C1H4K1_PARBA|nr:hypothetical protein PAAG_05694 [Paracoccidioides lutzii Pb01]EEH34645.2 hypothetical protein PAAG_05694 [Paracoccidioides lutzii Pb01]